MNEDFRSLLVDDAPTAALVSTRIAWGLIPQGSADPNISMHEISATPEYTLAGPDNLVPTRVQVDCRGTTYASALAVARAVRAKLSGFKGTKGSTVFAGIFQVGGRSYSEKPANQVYHIVSTDFEAWSHAV
jgi:hypothetical protein